MDSSEQDLHSEPIREIFTVSELNHQAKELLEGQFPLVWIEGEISNLARPASGHIYFSLKDEAAQVRCAMFKMRNRLINFQPENGQQVLARARVSLYEARGDFQLIIEHMEETGDGALRRQFELLKHRLYEEGLFDESHKQELPTLPGRLGVITSPTGAAIRDILSVLKRRFPGIPVLIYPVPVQGDDAPPAIVEALQTASKRKECDLLILARGGGSLEDLWAFNDESVARAIYNCPIPVVTGIGHEIDFTIADFVADYRAPTPSAAAETVSPDREEWQETLKAWQKRLARSLSGYLQQRKQALDWLYRQIKHPGQRLNEHAQRLDELEMRFSNALIGSLRHRSAHLATLRARIQGLSPGQRLKEIRLKLDKLDYANRQAIFTFLERDRQRLGKLGRALDTVSPLATLGRGYALAQTEDGRIIRSAGDVQVNDRITTRLGEGSLDCRVETVHVETVHVENLNIDTRHKD
ncbi:exodeoxyribonuclease VII large subunit [Kaarinaea lacus]